MSRRRSYYGGFTAFNPDVDALAFIVAHNLSTGLTMDIIQQTAIDGFIRRLKGQFTTNGSDIWTASKSAGSLIYPLCPINDSTANATAYQMELLSASSIGTYNNFLASDITPTGATGGTAKWFDTTKLFNFYNKNNAGFHVYSRNAPASDGWVMSAEQGVSSKRLLMSSNTTATNTIYAQINGNSSGGLIHTGDNSVGFYGAQRLTTTLDIVKNGNTLLSATKAVVTPSAKSIYIHARNVNDTATGAFAVNEFSMYIIGLRYQMTNALSDLNEAVQWYQTNVITGGRNV